MSAEIRPFSDSSSVGSNKIQLLSKLEGHQDVVNMAIILKQEDGVISISDDKYVLDSLVNQFTLILSDLTII